MKYTIFTRDKVEPKFFASGAINPGPPPMYGPGAGLFYRPPTLDVHSDNPLERRELVADPNGTATDGEIMAAFPQINAGKYQRLWEAASDWERRNISGVALALLTLGVAAGKPKAMSIAAWSAQLWNDTYYPRKALVRFDAEPDYDFSPVGDMPYSVPELSAEVWAK